jgi:hypothetical protein
MPTPFEQAKAILGEHFENYVIIVNPDSHECELEYNNAFAAQGMLMWAKYTLDSFYTDDQIDLDTEIIWDDDEEDDTDPLEDF